MKTLIIAIVLFLNSFAVASDYNLVSLDSPRKTMKTFLLAMQDYRSGVEKNDNELKSRIEDAMRTLNLSEVSPLIRQEYGRKAAIYLKEFIDRAIVIDLEKIPDSPSYGYWRLKSTEITIAPKRNSEDEKHSEYLFSPETVSRAKRFYEKTKQQPYLAGSGMGALYEPPIWEKHLPSWAQDQFLGLFKWQILGLCLALLFGFILKAFSEFLFIILNKLSKQNEDSLRFKAIRCFEKPFGLIVASAFWYSSLHFLKLEGNALIVFTLIIKLTFSVSLIWLAFNLCEVVSHFLQVTTAKTESTLDDQLVPLITKSLKVFVVTFGVLMTVQNLGINVMSLMAGLGLGGLAFALAAKDTAANLFGSIMIVLDRPFKIGDVIKTEGIEGTVEEIGFRSTRVRTFYKSLVSVPNSLLATAKIDNLGVRPARRYVMNLGLIYQTKPEQIEAFLEGVKNIIKANPYTDKSSFHVVFNSYGDFSLNVMAYFFFNVTDWTEELIQKQHINLEVLRLAKTLNVEFAFPTQSLFLEQTQLSPGQTPSIDELVSGAKSYGPNEKNSKPQGLEIYTAPSKES